MASFCRIRVALRARDCYLLAIPRRFASSYNRRDFSRLYSDVNKFSGVSEANYLNFRRCTTHVSVEKSEGSEAKDESASHSVEAIVSFERPENELDSKRNYRSRRLNPRKPRPIRSKHVFLQMFEEKLLEDELTEAAAYRCIKGCGNEMTLETEKTRSELLDHVWNTLKLKGCVLDISHYNALLSTYIENNHQFSPVDLLSELQAQNLQPNRITFSLLMRAYCDRDDIKEALNLMDFVKEETSFAASETLYAALIEGYSQAGDVDKALEVYNDMRSEDVEPALYCYVALLTLYARAGNVGKLDEVFNEMGEDGIRLDDASINKLLKAAVAAKDSTILEQVLTKLPGHTLWNIDVRSFFLRLLVQQNYEDAGKLLKVFPSWIISTENSPQDFAKHSLMIVKATIEEAKTALEKFVEQGVDFRMQEDLLDYSYRINSPGDSLALIKELHNNNETIKCHFFYPPITSYCQSRNYNGLKEAFELMTSCEIESNHFIKSQVGRLLQSSDNSEAKDLKEYLKNAGVTLVGPDMDDLLQSESNEEMLLSIFENEDAHVLSDWKTQSRIRVLLSRTKDEETAVQVFTKMSKKGVTYLASMIHSFAVKMAKQPDNELKIAAFLVKLMEKDIKDISSKTHTLALSSLQRAKRKDKFFDYIAHMKQHEIYADEHQYFQMLKMSATVGNSAAAQFCFDKIKNSPLDRANSYAHLIVAYGKDDVQRQSNNAQYADKIIALYDESKERGFDIFGQALSYTLLSYLSKADVESANEIIREHGDGTGFLRSLVYNEFLRAYGKRKIAADAIELFERMKMDESMPSPGRFSYNQLLGVYKAQGDYEAVSRRIQEMQDSNVSPDKYTYGELVKAHTVANDYSGAFDALESIKNEELRPHLGTYMNIIRKCVHNGDTESVRRGAALVKKHKPGFVTDSELSHSVVFSKVKIGDLAGAASEREDEKCDLEPKIVRRICQGASLAEDIDYLQNIKAFLQQHTSISTGIPDIALLRVYAKRRDLESARQLHESKLASNDAISMEFTETMDKLSNPQASDDAAAAEGEEKRD